MFYKKLILRISQNSLKKTLCGSLFLIMLQAAGSQLLKNIFQQARIYGYQFSYFLHSLQNLSVANKHIRKSKLIKNRPFLRLQVCIFVCPTLSLLTILFYCKPLSPILFQLKKLNVIKYSNT